MELDATPCKQKRRSGIFASGVFKGLISDTASATHDSGFEGTSTAALTLPPPAGAEADGANNELWNSGLMRPHFSRSPVKTPVKCLKPVQSSRVSGATSRTQMLYKKLFGSADQPAAACDEFKSTPPAKVLASETATKSTDHTEDNVFMVESVPAGSNMFSLSAKFQKQSHNTTLRAKSCVQLGGAPPAEDELKLAFAAEKDVFEFPDTATLGTSPPKAKSEKKKRSVSQNVKRVFDKGKKALSENFVAYKLKSKYGSGQRKSLSGGRKGGAAFRQVSALSSYTYKTADFLGIQESETPFTVKRSVESATVAWPVQLQLTVSSEVERESTVLKLIHTTKFKNCGSIMIVVLRQKEADLISSFLLNHNFTASSFHSGMEYKARQLVQQRFETGKIRIIVCTFPSSTIPTLVDSKSGIIFGCIPYSLHELANQLLNHAKGKELFLAHQIVREADYTALRSLAFKSGVEPSSVQKLLTTLTLAKDDALVFLHDNNDYYGLLLPLNDLEADLDCDADMLERLLKGLEKMVSPSLVANFYRNKLFCCRYRVALPKDLPQISDDVGSYKREWAILEQIESDKGVRGSAFFVNAQELCNRLRVVPQQLLQIFAQFRARHRLFFEPSSEPAVFFEVHAELCGKSTAASQFTVLDAEFTNLDRALDRVKAALVDHARSFEQRSAADVDNVYNTVKKFSKRSFGQHLRLRLFSVVEQQSQTDPSLSPASRSELLAFEQDQLDVEEHFERELINQVKSALVDDDDLYRKREEDSILKHVFKSFTDENLVGKLCDKKFVANLETELSNFILLHLPQFHSGRAVARVFHGISSPRYPFSDWCNQKCWGSYRDVPFELLSSLCQNVLIKARLSPQSK